MNRRLWYRIALALGMLTSVSCVRGCTSSRPPIHINPNMDSQPKAKTQAESGFFYDGATMRVPVEGTVARDEPIELSGMYTGRDAAGEFLTAFPMELTPEVMDRGQHRFAIYCRPCHGPKGDGHGVLFDKGVPVSSYFDERILKLSPGEIFDVVSNGKGLMPPYRYPIPAQDRWDIIAYVKRLQREWEESNPQ